MPLARGRNEKGQLGIGQGLSFDTYVMEPAPQQISFPSPRAGLEQKPVMSRMVCGYKHALAVSDEGALFMWGQLSQPLPTVFEKAMDKKVVQVSRHCNCSCSVMCATASRTNQLADMDARFALCCVDRCRRRL